MLKLAALLAGLTLVLGCGLVAPRSDGEPGSGFPHSDDWRWEHGEAGRSNPDACFTCHDEEAEDDIDYRGGERLPPCNGCHAWPLPEQPGEGEGTAALEDEQAMRSVG